MARMLVLDDEPLIATLLNEWLQELGHGPIHVSHSLADALAAAETASLDAAILDLILGQADSLPVAELLRRRGIPYALASGHGAPPELAGFDGALFLPKPFEFEDVRATVTRMLGRS